MAGGLARPSHRAADGGRTRDLKLARLGVSESDRAHLDRAIEDFDVAVPDARHARDVLEHFDEYARGEGRLQRKAIREFGIDVYEAAARYWGGGYDPTTEQITEGPFVLPRVYRRPSGRGGAAPRALNGLSRAFS